MKTNRNNTSFPAKLAEYMKTLSNIKDYPFLKYYQNITRAYLTSASVGTRGLLVGYEMGLGKSILAVAAAIDMMNDRQPIILLAKSLGDNMRGAIHKYVSMRAKYDELWPIGRLSEAQLDEWIKANFSFVSLNAGNMLDQMNSAAMKGLLEQQINNVNALESLDGKLLIVDEAHNLFRAIVNGSKNGLGLYNLVMKSKNLTIIFLTGTPIANDPFELVPCFNMLGGQTPILPTDYIEFNRLYVGADGRIANREKFQNRLFGMVSSQRHSWLGENESKGEFPERKPIVTVRVHMTEIQYVNYQLARDKEKEEGSDSSKKGPAQRVALIKPKSRSASSYRVKSRQLSNYDPTSEISPKFVAILNNIRKHTGRGLVYSQFIGDGGLRSFAKYLQANGWVEYSVGGGDKTEGVGGGCCDGGCCDGGCCDGGCCDGGCYDGGDENTWGSALPSVEQYFANITGQGESVGVKYDIRNGNIRNNTIRNDTTHTTDGLIGMVDFANEIPEPGLIGDALENSQQTEPGLIDGALELEDASVPVNTKTATKTALTYAIISGEVPVEIRSLIQKLYNTKGVDLLLVSSTGAEGLDLKRTMHIHIMEPYWNWGRIEQIIARGVRNDSHIDLPAEEKNVTPYIYLAIPPEGEESTITTDVELYEDALKNRVGVDSFIDAINEVSIECTLGAGRVCRMCSPTNESLFTDDATKDVRTRDPCVDIVEESVSVTEILIDNKLYHYSKNPSSVYGISVFDFDDSIGAYKLIRESNPIYQRIHSELNPSSL